MPQLPFLEPWAHSPADAQPSSDGGSWRRGGVKNEMDGWPWKMAMPPRRYLHGGSPPSFERPSSSFVPSTGLCCAQKPNCACPTPTTPTRPRHCHIHCQAGAEPSTQPLSPQSGPFHQFRLTSNCEPWPLLPCAPTSPLCSLSHCRLRLDK